jgi:hypothetical protein
MQASVCVLCIQEDQSRGAGIFSAARAKLIAETEITRILTMGHFEAWTQSGTV